MPRGRHFSIAFDMCNTLYNSFIALGLYEENECSGIRFPRIDKKYKVAGVPIWAKTLKVT
jgi:hypothetical protein